LRSVELAPSGNNIYVLLIAAFAIKGDQDGPRTCKGRCHRFRHPPGRCRFVTARSGADCSAATNTAANAPADPDAVAYRYQFRFVGRCGGDESRQQFPGAPWKSGIIRVRTRAADQCGGRRRVRSDGRAAFPDLGRGLRIWARTGAQGDFVGDRRQTWGGVGGIGARLAPGVNVGVSVDQSRTKIDVPLALQAATLDLTQIGANASVDKGPWTWAIALVHGFGEVNSSRDTGAGFARAGYNAHIDGALTELSYYRSLDQSRIVPKAAFEYVRASTASFQELGGLDPVMASGATVERSRILLGAEIGHYWIFDQKIFDLSAYGKFIDNASQNFGSVTVSLGTESIAVQGIAKADMAPTPAGLRRSA
jgi:autotransporter-like protein